LDFTGLVEDNQSNYVVLVVFVWFYIPMHLNEHFATKQQNHSFIALEFVQLKNKSILYFL